MKYKEIRVDVKFVKNLGNYQSFSPMAGVTVTVEDGDDVNKVFGEAWDTVKGEIRNQLKALSRDNEEE